jgi:hypothetical protein
VHGRRSRHPAPQEPRGLRVATAAWRLGQHYGIGSLARTRCRSWPSLSRGSHSERNGFRHDPVSRWQGRAICGRIDIRVRYGTSPEQECHRRPSAPKGADEAHEPDPPGRTSCPTHGSDQRVQRSRGGRTPPRTNTTFREGRRGPDLCAPDHTHRFFGNGGWRPPNAPDEPVFRCARRAFPKKTRHPRTGTHGPEPNDCALRVRAAGLRRSTSRRTPTDLRHGHEITRTPKHAPQKNPNRVRNRTVRPTARSRCHGRAASSNDCQPMMGRYPFPGSRPWTLSRTRSSMSAPCPRLPALSRAITITEFHFVAQHNHQ